MLIVARGEKIEGRQPHGTQSAFAVRLTSGITVDRNDDPHLAIVRAAPFGETHRPHNAKDIFLSFALRADQLLDHIAAEIKHNGTALTAELRTGAGPEFMQRHLFRSGVDANDLLASV